MRSRHRSFTAIVKGAVLVSAGSLINAASGFFAQTLVANGVQPRDYGVFVTSLAAINVFAPIAAFGAPQFILKIFGKSSQNLGSWLAATRSSIIISSIAAVILAALWSIVSQDTLHEAVSYRLLPAILATSICSVMVVMAQIEGRFAELMFWQIAQNVVRLVFVGVLLWFFHPTLLDFADAYGLAAVLVILFAYPVFHKYVNARLASRPSSSNVKSRALIRQTWVFAIEGFIYLAYYNAPLLLVGAIVGPAAAGFYAIGAAILTATYLLPASIFQRFFLARLHRAAYHDHRYLSLFLNRGAALSGAAGIIAGGVLYCVAEPAVGLLYGQSYRQAVVVLKVLAFSLPFRFAAYAPDSLMSTGSNQTTKLRIMTIMATACAIMVSTLSWLGGVVGAALAYVSVEIAFFLMMYVFALKHTNGRVKSLA